MQLNSWVSALPALGPAGLQKKGTCSRIEMIAGEPRTTRDDVYHVTRITSNFVFSYFKMSDYVAESWLVML